MFVKAAQFKESHLICSWPSKMTLICSLRKCLKAKLGKDTAAEPADLVPSCHGEQVGKSAEIERSKVKL